MKILVVCSSNVCRSPYAEFWLKKLVNNSSVLSKNIEWIDSSAVFNRSTEIFPKTKQCLIDDGFTLEEINEFKPSYIKDNSKPFDEADIIIGMTKSHKFLLPKKYRNKFFCLSEVAYGKYKAMPDPFLTKSITKYKKHMQVIKDAVICYCNKLEQKFSNNN